MRIGDFIFQLKQSSLNHLETSISACNMQVGSSQGFGKGSRDWFTFIRCAPVAWRWGRYGSAMGLLVNGRRKSKYRVWSMRNYVFFVIKGLENVSANYIVSDPPFIRSHPKDVVHRLRWCIFCRKYIKDGKSMLPRTFSCPVLQASFQETVFSLQGQYKSFFVIICVWRVHLSYPPTWSQSPSSPIHWKCF